MPPSPEEARRLLCALGDHVRDLVVASRGMDMAAVAGETVADTIYAIDRVADDALVRLVRGALARRRGRLRRARRAGARRRRRGLDRHRRHHRRHTRPHVRQAIGLVPGRSGTAGRRPGGHRRGGHDRTAHGQAGSGRPAERHPRRRTAGRARRPRAAARGRRSTCGRRRPTDLEHSFSGLAKFFLPGKAALAALEAELFRRLGVPRTSSTTSTSRRGGQLHELITGRDRFVADLRPLVQSEGLACHPYDVCTAMLLEEAGRRGHRSLGRPAGRAAGQRVPGGLGRLRQRGAGGAHRPGAGGAGGRAACGVARRGVSTCSVAWPTTRGRSCSKCRPARGPRSSPTPTTRFVVGPAAFSAGRARARWPALAYDDVRRELAAAPAVDALRHRRGRGAGAPRGDRPAAGAARGHVGSPGVGGRGVERGARGGHGARARRRDASTRSAWPRCARRRRTTWSARRAGSWTRSPWRWATPGSGAADPVPAGVGWPTPVPLPPGLEIVGWPTGTPHDVGGAALRAGPGGGLHGQAHGGGRGRPHVVLGERASTRTPSDELPDAARRARRSSTLGRDRRRRHDGPTRTRRIRSGPPRRSASRSTCVQWTRWRRWRDGEPRVSGR